MKNLKVLFCGVVLTFALGTGTTAMAQSNCDSGEPTSCGCYIPGQTQTPPCASAQLASDSLTEPSQTHTPLASDTLDVTSALEEALIAFLLF